MFTVQEQLKESLGHLMVQSENAVMEANLMADRVNGIQSTVAQYHEVEEESVRAIDECKEKLEKSMLPLVRFD